MLFLFCVLDVALFMKIWGCLSFGLLSSFAFFDSSGAFVVPRCVISIASCAFMIDAFAFICAMSFFVAFATCCSFPALQCMMPISLAIIALCDFILRCIFFRSVHSVI